MTRTYAAKRLLEHGPLTLREFTEITGWKQDTARTALRHLIEAGVAIFYSEPGCKRNLYRLADGMPCGNT